MNEKKLGIEFVKPNQESLEKLNTQISRLARFLNVPAPSITPPKKGFLAKPLFPDQEAEVINVLGPKYAKAGVNLQDNLASVSLSENREKMVHLPELFENARLPLSLSTVPFHQSCGDWAGKSRLFWARESVANKLLQASRALCSIGVQFHLEDAFRPLGVQEGLFFRRIKTTLEQHPEWANNWDLIWTEARSKTAVSPWMAGHKSGAAVDTTLCTIGGNILPVGNSYPEGGPKVAIHYPYVTQEQWSNRQIFKNVVQMVGLRIYPYENWHASYGDLSSAIKPDSVTGITPRFKTIYGPIKGFDKKTGEIDAYPKEEYFKPFYTIEELVVRLQNPS